MNNPYEEYAEVVVAPSAPRELWLEARRNLITASDAAALTGGHPYTTWDDLLTRKVTGDRLETNPAMWMGSKREANNIYIFGEAAGIRPELDVAGALLRSKRFPDLGATLDARVAGPWGKRDPIPPDMVIKLPPEAMKPNVVIEAKNVRSKSRSLWKNPSKPPNNTASRLHHYWCQVQQQLLVTGEQVGILFAIVDACEIYHFVIEASPKYQGLLVDKAADFLADLNGLRF